ncbi:hypothetical protein FGO68_gene9714 [Halteria grandinella]|uniref:Uncharacterized protein n=1 Tax=Halteria grandinella TaxID=5974 RepID=A0A8J8NSI5_HALGN|nr:hypothetical protein FGO68_gene9714 [Halteria grandinella]
MGADTKSGRNFVPAIHDQISPPLLNCSSLDIDSMLINPVKQENDLIRETVFANDRQIQDLLDNDQMRREYVQIDDARELQHDLNFQIREHLNIPIDQLQADNQEETKEVRCPLAIDEESDSKYLEANLTSPINSTCPKKRISKRREKYSSRASHAFTPSCNGNYDQMWALASLITLLSSKMRNVYRGNFRHHDTMKEHLEKPDFPGKKADAAKSHYMQILREYHQTHPQAIAILNEAGSMTSPISHLFSGKLINKCALRAFFCSQEAVQFYYSIPFLMLCRNNPHKTRPRHQEGTEARDYRTSQEKKNEDIEGLVQLARFIEYVQQIPPQNQIYKKRPKMA